MKNFLAVILFSVLVAGHAADKKAVTLDMTLSIDGQLVSRPRIVTLSGQTASISSVSDEGDGTFIEVTPTLKNDNEVLMKFTVAKVEKGQKTVLSRPQITSILGEKAEITQEATDGSHKTLSFVVTAKM